MSKTHWRTILTTDYLGGVDLDDGNGGHIEITATIDKAVQEKVKDQNGNEEVCLVLHFTGKIKPMILNVTNSKMIEKLFNSSYIEDWAGRQIQIGTEKVKAFGEVHDALRIRKFVPKTEKVVNCADCRQPITDSGTVPAQTIIIGTERTYGVSLCMECAAKRKGKSDAN